MPRKSKLHWSDRDGWKSTINGKRYYFGRDERKARAEWYRLMHRATADRPTDRPTTISGAIVAYLTVHDSPSARHWLKRFNEYAGSRVLDDVEADILTLYAVWLKSAKVRRWKANIPTPAINDVNAHNPNTPAATASNSGPGKANKGRVIETDAGLSPETIRHYVTAAAKLLRFCRPWLSTEPTIPRLTKGGRKPRDIQADALVDLFAKLPDGAGRVLRFIVATGCRPSEACRMTWADVRADAGVVVLAEHKTATKTGKPRTLYLTDDAIAVLRELSPSPGPVFVNRLGRPFTPAGLRSVARRAGFTPYQLRHTFAQRVSEALPADVLQKLMGHTDLATTQHYYDVRDGRIAAAVKQLGPVLTLRTRGEKGEAV
jgi:integrase